MPHRNNLTEIMTDKVPMVLETTTIGDVEKMLIKDAKTFESINYIYVIEKGKKLVGMLSIKELFSSPKPTLVSKVMATTFISAHVYTHHDRLAYLALKNNVKAVPVVDDENHLLGVVPAQEIHKILDQKAVSHIFRSSGVKHDGMNYDDINKIPLLKALRHRLPWLIFGLAGGMVAAGIVGNFEETLSKNLILAAFIPLIVYMADAVGAQMEAFIIRDMALNPEMKFFHYFFRQLGVVSLMNSIMSSIFFGATYLIYRDPIISVVLSLALFFAITSSLFSGLLIPFLFGKMKLDPANASGPVATIIQDILSVLVYFAIATLLL